MKFRKFPITAKYGLSPMPPKFASELLDRFEYLTLFILLCSPYWSIVLTLLHTFLDAVVAIGPEFRETHAMDRRCVRLESLVVPTVQCGDPYTVSRISYVFGCPISRKGVFDFII